MNSTMKKLSENVSEMSRGQIKAEFQGFEISEDGQSTLYTSRKPTSEDGDNVKVVLVLNQDTFEFTSKKVAHALVNICMSNPTKKEMGQKTLDKFLSGKGEFKPLKERKQREVIKNSMKKLDGFSLEVLSILAEELANTEDKGHLSETVYEAIINHEIY